MNYSELLERVSHLDMDTARYHLRQLAQARDSYWDVMQAEAYLAGLLTDIQELQRKSQAQVPALFIKKVEADV